jgi:translation initiation factor 2B subunit (eIF-2B alpha/beta/delta family)
MADRLIAVVRHRGAILCCQGADPETGLNLPSMAIEADDAPVTVQSLITDLGLGDVTVDRRRQRGESVVVLVTVASREVDPGTCCTAPVWKRPATLKAQGAVRAWEAYRAVAPTVETVATDTERGSTAIVLDALWALRDAATWERRSGDMSAVMATARQLLAARPAMAMVTNCVNRVMAGARTPAAVEQAAFHGIRGLHGAARAAARCSAMRSKGDHVLTVSRSGTVRAALLESRPEIEVLASLPGREGWAVGTALEAAGLSVSVKPDAAVFDRLRSGEIDLVLVGADAVTPAGDIVNKVGTRAAALAAAAAGVPFCVGCASDKVRPAAEPADSRPPLEPMFDLTPAHLVTAVLTDRGELTADGIAAIADEHRALSRWQAAERA